MKKRSLGCPYIFYLLTDALLISIVKPLYIIFKQILNNTSYSKWFRFDSFYFLLLSLKFFQINKLFEMRNLHSWTKYLEQSTEIQEIQ